MSRRTGNPLVAWCSFCMGPSTRCTCGVFGTVRMPGADAGGRWTKALAERETAEPELSAASVKEEAFSFETIEEYREAKPLPQAEPDEGSVL